MCGMTMDSFGDHALVCQCDGDRTIRHNRLRNIVFEEGVRAGLAPEREKQGLLPGQPSSDGVRSPPTREGLASRQRRRPADVFFPRGASGMRTALDFACTSGMRADNLREAANDPGSIVVAYEQTKRDFKPPGESDTTEVLCSSEGLQFQPMVVEAHAGGWTKIGRQFFEFLARQLAAATNSQAEVMSLGIAQRLAATLQRENARAVLRRMREPLVPPQSAEWHLEEEVAMC